MNAFCASGRSKDCMGEGLDVGSAGDQFSLMRQCMNNLNARFARVEDNVESLCTSMNVTYQLVKRVELHTDKETSSASATEDLHRLLAVQLQPLIAGLEGMQKQIGETTQLPSRSTRQIELLLTRMQTMIEQGFADLMHLSKEAPSTSSDNHGITVSDVDLDDSIAKYNLKLALHEEFAELQNVLLPMIASFQKSTLAEMKHHQDSVQLAILEQLSDKLATTRVSDSKEDNVTFPAREDSPLFAYEAKSVENELLVDQQFIIEPPTLSKPAKPLHYEVFAQPSKPEPIELREDSSMAAVFLSGDRVDTPIFNIENFYKDAGCAQAVARSDMFQTIAMLAVCMNAIWIGVEVEQNPHVTIYTAPAAFQIISQAFNMYWLVEWTIRLLAFHNKWDAFRDGWFRFDTFLVFTMVLDVWILAPIITFATDKQRLPISTQPLRMLRALKLIRMGKLSHWLPELAVMLKGMWRSGRAIAATGVLTLMMNYLWAIMIFMLLQDEDDLKKKVLDQTGFEFSGIGWSMWTLFIAGTLMLDGSALLMSELWFSEHMETRIAGFMFFTYSLVSALLLLQMLIGVLCDVVARVNRETRDSTAVALIRQELLARIHEADQDGDGMISQQELLHVVSDRRTVAVFNQIGINHGFLYQLQESIYANEEAISVRKALDLVLLSRSENQVTIEALAGGFSFMLTELQNHFTQQMQVHTKALRQSLRI